MCMLVTVSTFDMQPHDFSSTKQHKPYNSNEAIGVRSLWSGSFGHMLLNVSSIVQQLDCEFVSIKYYTLLSSLAGEWIKHAVFRTLFCWKKISIATRSVEFCL